MSAEQRRPGGAVDALRAALESSSRDGATEILPGAFSTRDLERATRELEAAGYVVHAPGEVCGVIPGARRSDPSTSSSAAERALPRAKAVAGALLRAYDLEDRRGPTSPFPPGLTADEATAELGGGGDGAWWRISDLHAAGLIEPLLADGNPITRPGRSGREQTVYSITAAGRQLVESWRS